MSDFDLDSPKKKKAVDSSDSDFEAPSAKKGATNGGGPADSPAQMQEKIKKLATQNSELVKEDSFAINPTRSQIVYVKDIRSAKRRKLSESN